MITQLNSRRGKEQKVMSGGKINCCPYFHSITEWLRLAGTYGDHLVHPHQEQAVQGCVQLGFEYLQELRHHNLAEHLFRQPLCFSNTDRLNGADRCQSEH